MVTVFILGIFVALIIDETTGITPGGIIVPGFLALAWGEPVRIVITLGAALLTVIIVQQLQRFVFVYGRRRFSYSVLTGVMLHQLFATVLPVLKVMSFGLLVIGYVLPGLIAENCLRQGVVRTITATIIATAVTRLLGGAVLGWMP